MLRRLIGVEVAVLLLADMRAWTHRSSTHRTCRPAARHERLRLFAECARLRPRQPERERRSRFFLGLDVMDHDDKAVILFVVAELHPPGPELIGGVLVR